MLSVATEVPAPYRPNELDLEIFLANFSERRHGEVRQEYFFSEVHLQDSGQDHVIPRSYSPGPALSTLEAVSIARRCVL
jgi:hypothetical protein